MSEAWQDIVKDLYNHLRKDELQRKIIRSIDLHIIGGEESGPSIVEKTLAALFQIADCRSIHLFLPRGAGLRHQQSWGEACRNPHLPLDQALVDIPSGRLLNILEMPKLSEIFCDDTQSLWKQDIVSDGKMWGLLLFESPAPVIREGDGRFFRHVCEQLGIALSERAGRRRLEAYKQLHLSFFSADLEEGQILEILGSAVSELLKGQEKYLIQLLYRQDAGLSKSLPKEEGLRLDQLFIRWSSKSDEIGTIVPMESVSGRLLLSGKREALLDPTEETVREFYKDFSDFETRTEFAVVIQSLEASEGIGVLNIELPTPNALLPNERQEIKDLIEMVAPLISAVRRRNTMALTMRKAYVYAVNGYLTRTTALYAHKFGRLVTLRFNLDELKEASAKTDWKPDPKLVDNIKGEVQWFEEALASLWEAISNVAEIVPIRIVDVLTEIAHEEATMAHAFLEWDPQAFAALPPVRASRVLKEHLRNLLENAADSIREKQWRLGKGFKGSIRIVGEETTRKQSHSDGQHDIIKDLNRRVKLTIIDNGEGIPPDLIDQVFQPGFTTKADGTGFGLPAAREYMRELMGILLRPESKPGEGCKIVLEIPIFDNSPATAGPLGE